MSFKEHNDLLQRKAEICFIRTKELLNLKLVSYSVEHKDRSLELNALRKESLFLVDESNKQQVMVSHERFSSLEKRFDELLQQIEMDQAKQLLVHDMTTRLQVASYLGRPKHLVH